MAKFVEKIVSEVVKGVVNEVLKKSGLSGRSRSTTTRSKASSGGILGSILDAALGNKQSKSTPKRASSTKKKTTSTSKPRTTSANSKKSASVRKPKS